MFNDITYSFFLDGVVGNLCAREQSSGNVNFFVFIYTLVYYITQCVALTLAFLCGLGAKN